jgi:hypothetical protein
VQGAKGATASTGTRLAFGACGHMVWGQAIPGPWAGAVLHDAKGVE